MKHVSCSCGGVVSAETAEELLEAVEAHIAAAHGLQATPVEKQAQAVGATVPETKEER